MVWGFGLKNECLNLVNKHYWLEKIHNVRVFDFLELADKIHGVFVLLLVHVGDVHEDAHGEA